MIASISNQQNTWIHTTLSEFCGQRGQSIEPSKTPDSQFELYSVPSFPTGQPEIVSGKEVGSNKQMVTLECVLLSKINPRINRAWVVGNFSPHTKIASTEWIVFPPDKRVEPRFLCYFLKQNAVRDFLASNVSGVGGSLMRVKPSTLRDFPFGYPERDDQSRIVAEIEKQFSRLDEAVGNLKRVKANLKRYKASILKAAVEGALVPIKNRQATKIGEVADLVTKGSSPNWQGFTYTDSGVAFVRSQNVGWGSLDLSDVAHLSPAFNEKERKSVLRTGDVLLNIVGASIGRAAVATPEIEGGNVNQAVAVIRLNPERMLPKYLMLNLLSPGTQAAIHAEKVDVARANVSLSDIKDFSVLFPSLAEQGTMIAEVERRLSIIEELETAVQANLTRADRLRQSILSQAFSGRLLGQDTKHIQDILPTFSIAAESQARYGRDDRARR